MHKSETLKRLIAFTALAAMFSTVSVHAQTTASATQKKVAGQTESSSRLSDGDEKALKDMAQANINEIAAAKIAQSMAHSSEVKSFAQQMIKDHVDALTKVQTIAQKKGVELPTEPDEKHKAMGAKLEKQSGDEFDKMYMENAGTKDHKIALSTLQSESSKIKDTDVKALAEEHTPVVEQHLKSAQQISK